MSGILQSLCDDELHEVPDVKAVGSGVEPDIKTLRTAVEQLFEFVFVDGLFYETAFAQFVDNVEFGHKYHLYISLL